MQSEHRTSVLERADVQAVQIYDTVVVGAGAAGIGAGTVLSEQGIDFAILEASNRVGGRAFTDDTSLAVPWDHGCHWFHDAENNPLVAWADALGVRYEKQTRIDHFAYWRDGAFCTPDLLRAARAATMGTYEAIDAAARTGRDAPLEDFIDRETFWSEGVRAVLRTVAGQEPRLVSSLSFGGGDGDGGDWPLIDGYGTLFEKMARDLPIHLSCPVDQIEEKETGVVLRAAGARFYARTAILTPSTNVLASGALGLSKGPAKDVVDQLHVAPCGAYEKVAYCVPELPGEVRGKLFCMIDPGHGKPAFDVELIDGEQPLLLVHVSGDVASELAAEGKDALNAFTDNLLRLAFGQKFLDSVSGRAATSWTSNHWIQGSYSNPRPGMFQAYQNVLAQRTGRIKFAGEAFSRTAPSTAHGAFQSGCEAAKSCLRLIEGD
ncbi:MAG: FAD-dependent oxidoreductase [Pseudomonadota bacterium]